MQRRAGAPLVWAARAAGHEVLLATTSEMCEVGAQSGLPVVDVFPDRRRWAELMALIGKPDAVPDGLSAEIGMASRAHHPFGMFTATMTEPTIVAAGSFDPELIVYMRARIWPEVVERIAAAPLTGYGFGRGLFRHALTDEFQNGLIWHAHNLFLDTALQTGLPGLLLFLLLLAVIAREGWGAARAGDDATAAYGIALLGLLTGMVVRNMTDTMLVRQNALFFWAVAGFLIGSIRAGRPSLTR